MTAERQVRRRCSRLRRRPRASGVRSRCAKRAASRAGQRAQRSGRKPSPQAGHSKRIAGRGARSRPPRFRSSNGCGTTRCPVSVRNRRCGSSRVSRYPGAAFTRTLVRLALPGLYSSSPPACSYSVVISLSTPPPPRPCVERAEDVVLADRAGDALDCSATAPPSAPNASLRKLSLEPVHVADGAVGVGVMLLELQWPRRRARE
jgi:hypothetical protein